MSEFLYRAKLRGIREINKFTRRPLRALLNPFNANPHAPIIHRCYHKVGTVWFGRILRHIAAEFGLQFASTIRGETIKAYEARVIRPDILLDLGSHINLEKLPLYRGSHMVRDPRDLIVSAYFYHKWTNEKWANVPKAEYDGATYKEHLNRLPKDEGILLEIHKSKYWVQHMAEWSFSDPCIMELRYEDLLLDEDAYFPALFKHYGLSDRATDKCVRIAKLYSFENFKRKQKKGAISHLRSGRAQEWQDHFNADHVSLFKSMHPGVVPKLGYAPNDNW